MRNESCINLLYWKRKIFSVKDVHYFGQCNCLCSFHSQGSRRVSVTFELIKSRLGPLDIVERSSYV
jgi:hypothetical protein